MHDYSLIEVAIFGFLAQIVDGTLGMGYGVTSTSLLIFFGLPPQIASASVHTAEIFTTFVSGIAHFKLGNIRKELVKPLVTFGIIGGILGACGLIKLPPRPIKLVVGIILFTMGLTILYRFTSKAKFLLNKGNTNSPRRLGLLGFFAAFIDAMGGGGWGPICTSTLVFSETEPRYAIGTINFTEFFITVPIAVTFFILIGPEKFRWDLVLALLIGGVVAAPIAAFLCKHFPKRLLGFLIGILVMILSLRMIILK
ncbi:MAG: sulfite exporter TauE/SafE family protein [Candidatus Omnitrophota bacterium]